MSWGFLRRYVLSFGDQGLTALLSLCVALTLIRFGAEWEFGAYIFWASVSLVVSGLAGSLTVVHLHRLRPAPLAGRRNMERVLLAITLVLAGLAAVGTLLALPLLRGPLALWGAVLLVPGALVGIYARALATSRGRVGLAFLVSLAVFVTVVLGLLAGALLGAPPTANTVLALSGLSQGLAGGWVLARLSAGHGLGWGRGRWRILLARSRWPLAGSAATEVYTRLYVFLVSALAGTLAMAALAASQTLLRPATLLAGAFAGAARTTLAQRRHAGDRAGFLRIVAIGAIGPTLATLALGLLLAGFWPFVSAIAFGGRYTDQAPAVLLWTITMAISCGVHVFGAALQALGALRDAARAEVAAALVVAVAMAPALLVLPPESALMVMLLGALAQLGLQWRALRRPWGGLSMTRRAADLRE